MVLQKNAGVPMDIGIKSGAAVFIKKPFQVLERLFCFVND